MIAWIVQQSPSHAASVVFSRCRGAALLLGLTPARVEQATSQRRVGSPGAAPTQFAVPETCGRALGPSRGSIWRGQEDLATPARPRLGASLKCTVMTSSSSQVLETMRHCGATSSKDRHPSASSAAPLTVSFLGHRRPPRRHLLTRRWRRQHPRKPQALVSLLHAGGACHSGRRLRLVQMAVWRHALGIQAVSGGLGRTLTGGFVPSSIRIWRTTTKTWGGDWGPGRTPCSASSFSGKADIHCPGTKTRPRRSAPSDACATRRGMCEALAGGPLSFAGKKPCDLYPKGHFCATPSSVLALRESSAWRTHLLAMKCHQRQATMSCDVCQRIS